MRVNVVSEMQSSPEAVFWIKSLLKSLQCPKNPVLSGPFCFFDLDSPNILNSNHTGSICYYFKCSRCAPLSGQSHGLDWSAPFSLSLYSTFYFLEVLLFRSGRHFMATLPNIGNTFLPKRLIFLHTIFLLVYITSKPTTYCLSHLFCLLPVSV